MTIREKVLKNVDSLAGEIIALGDYIHRHPELGYEEHKAAERLTSLLEGHGFTVERRAGGIATAFTARTPAKAKGPTVGLIAEYDALPGLGHGCGHDLIAASAYGAAIALAPYLRETGGSICVFGTPAEENDGGKIPLLERGVFDGADAVLCMHPESVNLVNTKCLALEALEFNFKGRSAHAAAAPHEGVNALDAVILLFNGVNALRQQVRSDVRIHGIITDGGKAANIIPDRAQARFYARSESRAGLDEVCAKVRLCARGAAKATGCRLRIHRFERTMFDMINDPLLMELMEKNLRLLGIDEIAREEEEPGSSDIGNVSHLVPSLYFYVATAPKSVHLHTKEFTRSGTAEMAREGVLVAAKAMALTALDILTSEEIADRLRRHRVALP